MQEETKQKTIAIYMPEKLIGLVEEARVRLGMNRSRFIQFAVLKTLEDLSMLTKAVHADDVLTTTPKEVQVKNG